MPLGAPKVPLGRSEVVHHPHHALDRPVAEIEHERDEKELEVPRRPGMVRFRRFGHLERLAARRTVPVLQ